MLLTYNSIISTTIIVPKNEMFTSLPNPTQWHSAAKRYSTNFLQWPNSLALLPITECWSGGQSALRSQANKQTLLFVGFPD